MVNCTLDRIIKQPPSLTCSKTYIFTGLKVLSRFDCIDQDFLVYYIENVLFAFPVFLKYFHHCFATVLKTPFTIFTIFVYFNFAQRIRASLDEKAQKDLLKELEIVMRTSDCLFIVNFYGAIFKEVSLLSDSIFSTTLNAVNTPRVKEGVFWVFRQWIRFGVSGYSDEGVSFLLSTIISFMKKKLLTVVVNVWQGWISLYS